MKTRTIRAALVVAAVVGAIADVWVSFWAWELIHHGPEGGYVEAWQSGPLIMTSAIVGIACLVSIGFATEPMFWRDD